VFLADVSGGWALFGPVRGPGACGAVSCGSVCSRACHCSLGLARSARLLRRRALSRGRAHELAGTKKGDRENE